MNWSMLSRWSVLSKYTGDSVNKLRNTYNFDRSEDC